MSKYTGFRGIIMLAGVLFAFGACDNNTRESDNTSSDTAEVRPEFTAEIEELAGDAQIRKALDLIEAYDSRTLQNQIKLTELEAPPFQEHDFGRGLLFADLLKEYGADSVWTDSIGNVIGLRKGKKREKVLAVAGHLDTVFPAGTDVNVVQKGDTLFAPGIADDGRGIAAVLNLLQVFSETGIRTDDDILFIGDVGEEGLGDLRGMKHLFREGGPQIDYFISIEPGSYGRITNGGLGSHRYRITYHGPGGHSWGAFGLANPMHALGTAINEFVIAADRYTKDGLKTSYNVGRIEGGTSVNSIPFSVWMEVDMRSLSQQRLQEIDNLLQEAVQKGLTRQNGIRRHGPELTVDVEMIGNRPSGHTSPEEPLVQRALATAIYAGAEKPTLGTGSTDSNIPISMGIPAITLGGGGISGGAHSLDEWYINKDAWKAVQRVFLVIAAQAGY